MCRFRLIGLVALVLAATTASAKLPVRNMTVELRVLSQAESHAVVDAGYVVRSRPVQDTQPQIQKIFVMNGEKAQLKLGLSVPVQWIKTAVTSTAATQGAEQTTAWMDAGQGISVQVRWPGGKQPASVEVEVDTAALEQRPEKNLPSQMRSRVATTVLTPLGEWATIAVTGPRQLPEQAGVYATAVTDSEQGKMVQIRVLAP